MHFVCSFVDHFHLSSSALTVQTFADQLEHWKSVGEKEWSQSSRSFQYREKELQRHNTKSSRSRSGRAFWGSQCKFGPKKRIKAPRKRSKIVKWMGSGLPGKKKQRKEAAPKYNISNAFERESGLIEQGR